jgi:transposase-like protein
MIERWVCSSCEEKFDAVITSMDSKSKDWITCDVHGLSLHLNINDADAALDELEKIQKERATNE